MVNFQNQDGTVQRLTDVKADVHPHTQRVMERGLPRWHNSKESACQQQMQEKWVRSLGWEDSLEKEMATHSRILAWGIPWTEEPDGLQSMGSQRVGHD